MNILIILMYDGTEYHGFQRQKNGITVQETLEKAVEKVTGEKSTVTGCGRTDAGVHAQKYGATFKSNTKIPLDKLPFALNSALPDDIRVTEAYAVSDDFHPVFSLTGKTYRYKILNRKIDDVFLRHYAWFYPYELDVDKMRKAAAHFLGRHDFSGFMATGSNVKTTVRTIKRLDIEDCGDGQINIYASADGFLYNMVRIITGTLVAVGGGKIDPSDIPGIISSCDRTRAGATAPPQGLSLFDIEYRKEDTGGQNY